ncbi:hypothetical protein BDP81DRAFT_422182 [Colletotrichum phormii]|uniref:Uncharacterized protein n=1 Tax=Colletotrichum phormii TaxID=359342 RepID=A0AAI9ZXD0_9PEZI|nr:uncharacterized protein BDP81DRAFT_422182 [Colletotrichum phormii]KAK1639972.1 hypothetical protein BDP81DRAFT_422182 [Colletotrichum phormii]
MDIHDTPSSMNQKGAHIRCGTMPILRKTPIRQHRRVSLPAVKEHAPWYQDSGTTTTAVSRIRGSFCPMGGHLSSALFSFARSVQADSCREDPFPHLMQRQAMTYLRQLQSTSPLGPCLLMVKKLLQLPSLNPLAGTKCNLGARRTAASPSGGTE